MSPDSRSLSRLTMIARWFGAGCLVLAWPALLRSSPEAVARAAPQETSSEIASLKRRVASLEAQLELVRKDYDTRLAAIEERLAALTEARSAATSQPPAATAQKAGGDEATLSEEERAALERELGAIRAEPGGQAGAPAARPAPQEPAGRGERQFVGRNRTLNQLNPEISVTSDVFGTVADSSESSGFNLAEFELAFEAPLDPFSTAKAFVVQEEGEIGVEEAYIDWTALPGALGLKLGQYRNDWGKLNRWHQHALPQSDRPRVHEAFFGEEGLSGLGVSLSWLPPNFLGDYNELWFQVTNDENEVAFSGRGFDDPIFVLHETNYWDLSPAAYLEVGLSAATGVNDPLGRFRTQVYGVDWSFDWRPPERTLYKGLEVRGELLWQRREQDEGVARSWGAYTYASYKLNRRWFVGLRGDWTQLPREPGADLWGVSPYAEWWQSEWVRVRFQYSHSSRQLEVPEPENRAFFQVTWALGPHKHEKY